MTAGRYNFTIEQQDGFSTVLSWSPGGILAVLTGFTATLIIENEISGQPPILTLTTTPNANGDVLTLGGSAGTITVTISSTTTSTMSFGDADYLLRIIDPTGKPRRLLQGVFSLSPGTT